MTSPQPTLHRGLGLPAATSFVVGGIVGAGIFRTPSLVAAEMGSPGATMMLWVLGGIVALCGALTIAELGAMLPRAGGVVVFLQEAWSPQVAFLNVWLLLFVLRPASAAAIATVFAEYANVSLSTVVETPAWFVKALAISMLLLLGWITVRGVKLSGAVQTAATVLKVLGILVIIVLGLTMDVGSVEHMTPFWPDDWGQATAGFGTAMIACTYSYGGWDASTGLAEEIRDPTRNVPRSIFVGIGVVIALYLLINGTFLYVLPFEVIANPDALVAADSMEALAGHLGLMFISGAVLVSTFGVMQNGIVVTPRAYFSMAREGLFFPAVQRIHPKFRTPWIAVACHVGGAIFILLVLKDFSTMLRYSAPAGFVFLMLAVAGVYTLRRKAPDAERPYRTWGYPVTPALFLGVGSLYLGSVLWTAPESFSLAAVVLLVGLVAWRFYFKALSSQRP
jgi:APA family basic amino acid/polyamine antiporter